jgi:hypothetical protein
VFDMLRSPASVSNMARRASDNVHQISFKVPAEWLAMAEDIAKARALPGATLSCTEILRAALLRGLTELNMQVHDKRNPKERK